MSWGRRRKDYWGGWPRYVPVAERKEKARKQAEKFAEEGGFSLAGGPLPAGP